MNNPALSIPYAEGEPRRRLRRWPWLSKEDARMLEQLEPEAARQMANLLYTQAYSDQRYRERHLNFTDFAPSSRDVVPEGVSLVSAVTELGRYTTGGGRQLRHLPTDP